MKTPSILITTSDDKVGTRLTTPKGTTLKFQRGWETNTLWILRPGMPDRYVESEPSDEIKVEIEPKGVE